MASGIKSFLTARGNCFTEHNILCMWRVVILQNFCFVQNYFPNSDGNFSDTAPTLVYKNTGSNSYYSMYLEMFNLIKLHPATDVREPMIPPASTGPRRSKPSRH